MASPAEKMSHGRNVTSAHGKNGQTSLRSDDDDQSSHATKRQRIAIDNPIHGLSARFQHEDYTVAWICALHIELAAARAMLDNIHDGLPMAPDDTNSYVLGNIGQHNIVIAGLPAGYYGLNNAATVASNIERSFPSLHIRLMVGIGGGAPGKLDLRLGDIVVGSRVMQYDFGKIVGNGQIERTSLPIIPPSKLLTHITKLRAIHESTPSRVPSILQAMHNRYPAMTKYTRPISQDQLFCADYHHNPAAISCDGCDSSMLMHRPPRTNTYPKIHYEAIASSNQVMKHGITRDEIAKDLQVVCFEMEAAGLANFPCLVIRGICDYSDSHKNKQWQEYAAAVAAAYAKEFLEAMPMPESKVTVVQDTNSRTDGESSQNLRKQFLTSLRFEQIYSRQSNIKAAHATTCKWLLKSPEYLAWIDPKNFSDHHGFLWLSGKPGAGKSTIMKFVYTNVKRASHASAAVVSFFFNARGDYLEKSVTGMYRSLLLQLLERFPDLQQICDDSSLTLSSDICPDLDIIQSLLRKAISLLGQRSLTCFIDALDECDEQQVRDMVEYFEELGQRAVEDEIGLRICFSSRHYPYIFIRNGVRLTLEDQKDHEEDLKKYVHACLRADPDPLINEVQAQILQKAAGVFMWVVLVVDILNKEFQRGRMFAVKKRLEEIPDRLSDLFKDILRRDNENMEDLLLCLQWILFAKRPLTREEFYFAVSTGLFGVDEHPAESLTTSITSQSMDRFVISSSKGLAEVTKSKHQTVQFIHESVRDFLIKDNGLQELWPELSCNFESFSHERLRQCCSVYLQLGIFASVLIHRPSSEKVSHAKELRERASKEFPFLQYATQHILHHANMAASTISQSSFLAEFSINNWIMFHNIFEIYGVRRYTLKASLFYILADKGFAALIRTNLCRDSRIYRLGERYQYPLFTALINGHEESVQAFLEQDTEEIVTEDLGYIMNRPIYEDQTPLLWALLNGYEPVAKLLIEKGAAVHMTSEDAEKAFFKAAEKGHNIIMGFLIKKNIDVNNKDNDSRTALMIAIEKEHDIIARLLIENGADVNSKDNNTKTALLIAVERGRDTIAKLLIKNGADINAKDKDAKTAMFIATTKGYDTIVRLLIENGVDVNAKDKDAKTALLLAVEKGRDTIAKLLIENGANVNTKDKDAKTAMFIATTKGYDTIVRLLIENGVDVNAKDKDAKTALLLAVEKGRDTIAKLLIENGANVNTKDKDAKTAMFIATTKGYNTIVGLLIENGVNVNAKDKDAKTALFIATTKGYDTIVRLLIENGANVNAKDKDARTAMFIATTKGYNTIVRLLIENGVDVNAKDKNAKTALHLAVEEGRDATVRLLIEEGADINARNNKGQTALFLITKQRHIARKRRAIAKLLIEEGAETSVRDHDGLTALLYATKNGHLDITSLLIETGAYIDDEDESGQTALFFMQKYMGPEAKAIIQQLIDKGADVNAKDNSGHTALWGAVVHNREDMIKQLIENGSNPNIQDNSGQTALWAAYRNEDITKLLLENGADPRVQDHNGQTALWAAWSGDVVRVLIKNNANPNIRDNNGQTALWTASSRTVAMALIENGADPSIQDNNGQTALWTASSGAVAKMLIQNGADPSIQDNNGQTAPWTAWTESILKVFIGDGADPNTKDSNDQIALQSVDLRENTHGKVI